MFTRFNHFEMDEMVKIRDHFLEVGSELNMPIFEANQLREQFEAYIGEPCDENIDWEALEERLKAYCHKVIAEYRRRTEINRIKMRQLGLGEWLSSDE